MRALLAALASVIPWIPAVPPPTPHPPLAPPCLASQMRDVSYEVQGATGSLAGGVNMRNVGPPCSLAGRPQVSFDPPHALATTRGMIPPSDHPVPPSFSLRAIPTGADVEFSFWWSNWCAPSPTTMVVGLPHEGGAGRIPIRGAPRCDVPTAPSTISPSRLTQAPPPPSPSTHLPFAVRFTELPYAAHADSMMRFQVTLRNTSGGPYRFGKCPVYSESLVETTIIQELHVLNCRPAGVIAPGATRVFAMAMRVPARAAGKRWALFFELGPDTHDPDEVPGPNPLVDVS
jgi:hypothetical protein